MTAYYNENDPKAAVWLRKLIRAGHIANGEVDERSIEDVTPSDLAGFVQCHWFAGIGGWSYALRLAGWSDDRPVWTGSCPCQPFSAAGKGAGFADERHLWGAWFHLLRECRPQRIFGEQVASALSWLDLVSADLEGEGYAVGSAIVGAHSVGAPHIRQRLYWMANSDTAGRSIKRSAELFDRKRPSLGDDFNGCGTDGGMADCEGNGRRKKRANGGRGDARNGTQGWAAGLEPSGNVGEMCDADQPGPQRRVERRYGPNERAPWAPGMVEWISCTDGRVRPTQPGVFPLAHGVSGRVAKLRGLGNAIVPQVAAAFIEACA